MIKYSFGNYGRIFYDFEGKPICHICGRAFHRLLSHVRQKHNLTAKEYKKKFGLNIGNGIISNISKSKSQIAVFNNYNKVVEKNLIKNGKKTRFKIGDKGRTVDKMSEQERLRLKKFLNSEKMKKIRKDIGRKLGLSGKGNMVRWKNYQKKPLTN